MTILSKTLVIKWCFCFSQGALSKLKEKSSQTLNDAKYELESVQSRIKADEEGQLHVHLVN